MTQLSRSVKSVFVILFFLITFIGWSQQADTSYKRRVLETSEIDLLFSYYNQDGQNAAVTGGEGTEELTDATSSIVLRMPMNEDDILTVDVGLSAYTSASSSNVNPLDGGLNVTPFDASSGESRKDMLVYINPSYQHSSDDRNTIWSANAYFSSEYDYSSIGFGGSFTKLFNEKNTEITLSGRVFLDKWNSQYPIELREGFFDDRISGNGTYSPIFTEFDDENRNSYSLSLSFSQILSQKLQGALFMDVVSQNGLLSTPFQRVYFSDFEDFYIDEFQLADNVEQLPDSRFKLPVGGRLNYYLNDLVILRSYYRFYWDDWGISSHTASLEAPFKLTDKFTLFPTYRYYTQTAADYFYPKEQALSTYDFYTSDYDLSNYDAHQYGIGVQYKDIFTSASVLNFGLKTINLRFSQYDRSDGLSAFIVTLGTTFVGN
ncbi:DUF3570 domain-containing protein [Flagellimonas marinaquae]|uniref:DUF3570 domain-containing protein n=1 Tax=Flagellimonas aurea TaxID=2915619 RepID=A0ABS3G403_9FLAO|nr:DUF3570 domain-containing protein [Allomuricauda aurea]MAO17181.1 hypothetical protein [Allomuricauda sp.]MBO0353784.1 DUF3570 domain-containing protein [Allomuricauda aurea]UBZ14864.1 DUF3570 domain-containing protein [Allomuricauda aquimarina]